VEFAAGTIKDIAGNSYAGVSDYNFTTAAAPDTIAPTVTTFSPADETTAVPIGSNIVLTFSEAVQRGSGNIVLKTSAGAVVATYDAATSANLSISGSSLTINPTADLGYSTGYKVEFAAGSIKDIAGNNYAGVSDYNFTTASSILIGTSGDDSLVGTENDDGIFGFAGNDTLLGAAGGDSLDGGAGNDELVGGVGQDTLLGDSGADTLYGGDGNDSVVGGAGNDLIIGGDGAGDDTYAGGDGIDTVKYTSATAAIVVDLAASSNQAHSVSADNAGIGVDQLSGIENVIAGNYDDILSGDSKDNTFTGGAGNDTLSGGTGKDTAVYSGARSNYTITTTAGGLSVQDNRSDGDGTDLISGIEWLKFSDVILNLTGLNLIGSAFANRLTGDAGNDTLYGAGGIDVLDGKDGSDLYLIGAGDHPSAEIKDTGALGVDELRFISTTAATLTLFAGDTGIEKVVMGTGTLSTAITSGKAALNVDASAVLNSLTIVGNDGANSIKGTSQADTISGGAGNDTLSGGAGADNLDGGLGDDSYVIDDAGDQVTEAENAGTDLVQSSVSYTLGANLEKLTLSGTAAINGTGNSLANTITGNAGANSLDGGDGNDTLMGGDGLDSLTGGAGSDVFKLSSAASQNMDTILDFVSGEDKIYLSKAAFAKVGSSGNLKANAFYTDANATAGHDADDRIVYNSATGALYYDADGSGSVAAVQIAIIGVGNHPTMGAADLVVY
jgi:Ca2+-binding RTX toxin-like protein